MSTQISLKLSDSMLERAKVFVELKGYDSLQDFIRETVRQRLFEPSEKFTGLQTSLASEESLAKKWMNKEEDKAWEHLEKEFKNVYHTCPVLFLT